MVPTRAIISDLWFSLSSFLSPLDLTCSLPLLYLTLNESDKASGHQQHDIATITQITTNEAVVSIADPLYSVVNKGRSASNANLPTNTSEIKQVSIRQFAIA